jgi:hypothetical protein
VTAYKPLATSSETFEVLGNLNDGLYNSNLCAHVPLVPDVCNHPQGMLGSRRGAAVVGSLYGDSIPEIGTDEGMGLFLNGGDLLYRNRRAANQEGHSILQEGVKGIGGHHLVLSIKLDPDGGNKPYMIVQKAPLSYTRLDRTTTPLNALNEKTLLEYSQQSGNLTDWYQDLDPIMRGEAARLLTLYPIAAQSTTHKWSCPMRRLSFWSNLKSTDPTTGFSPVSPSPPRVGRLFGGV